MVPPHPLVLDPPPPVWIVYCYSFYVLEKVSTTKGSFVAHPSASWPHPGPPTPCPPPPAAVLRPLACLICLSGLRDGEVGGKPGQGSLELGRAAEGQGRSVKRLWTGGGLGIHYSFAVGRCLGQGRGHRATAMLVGQVNQGRGAWAPLRARKALPRLLAWFPVITAWQFLVCLQVRGRGVVCSQPRVSSCCFSVCLHLGATGFMVYKVLGPGALGLSEFQNLVFGVRVDRIRGYGRGLGSSYSGRHPCPSLALGK